MPENSAYFHAAYAVTIVFYLAYGASLVLRRRALAKRRATLGRDAAGGGGAA